MQKITAIETIHKEVVELNTELAQLRRKENYLPVIGEGNPRADIMFIGEAPGKNEALSGRPFCGASGRILDELLDHISLKRENVYITNIVKDRPPANRDPKPTEIEAYAPFLDRQIEIIQPKVIATLGRFSMEHIMKRYEIGSQIEPISVIHGTVFDIERSHGAVKIVPLFHPAVALYNASRKGELQKDFEIVQTLY